MMKRHAWWVVLAVMLVTGLAITGATSASSIDFREGTMLEGDAMRDVAPTIWFQGFLADYDTGDPVNATYNIVARIFAVPSGGGALWGPETHHGVTITQGWFNIELGSVIGSLPDFATPPYFVELIVDGEILAPRLKLASVPTALHAGTSDDGDYWYEIDEGIAYADTIAIGTSYPDELLTISPLHFGDVVFQRFRPIIIRDGEGGDRFGEGAVLGLLPMDPDFYIVNEEDTGWTWLGAGNYPTAALTDSAKFVISPYAFGGGGPRSGLEPPAALTVDCGDVGMYGAAIYASHDYEGSHVVHAEYYGDAPAAVAVYGDATSTDLWGIGGEFHGSTFGAVGMADGSQESGTLTGLLGIADDSMGVADYVFGVYGMDPAGGPRRAIESYSGYFEGDVYVGGFLDYPVAASKIDHPLDPTNMTLSHAAVESPDMMNVYNGNVVLDGTGEATVQLPDYFDALNSDFRYQLTCIGGFAPVYIAEEIAGNSFRIAGGEAGMKISWMVTGIRSDSYAQQNRVVVEEPKIGRAVGRYLQPEAYGMPATMGVEYNEELESRRAAAAAANAERSARVAAQREQAKAASDTESWRKK